MILLVLERIGRRSPWSTPVGVHPLRAHIAYTGAGKVANLTICEALKCIAFQLILRSPDFDARTGTPTLA